jgi:hypothetical protein
MLTVLDESRQDTHRVVSCTRQSCLAEKLFRGRLERAHLGTLGLQLCVCATWCPTHGPHREAARFLARLRASTASQSQPDRLWGSNPSVHRG